MQSTPGRAAGGIESWRIRIRGNKARYGRFENVPGLS